MTKKILLALLCCSAGLSGCERLSEKDKMDMIAKCDTEARKKIKERSDQGRYPGGGDWYEDTVVTTHYSFSEKQCFALEETFVIGRPWSDTRTLYDGLTKKELIKTIRETRDGIFEERHQASNSLGLSFESDSDLGKWIAAEKEIDRLMIQP